MVPITHLGSFPSVERYCTRNTEGMVVYSHEETSGLSFDSPFLREKRGEAASHWALLEDQAG